MNTLERRTRLFRGHRGRMILIVIATAVLGLGLGIATTASAKPSLIEMGSAVTLPGDPDSAAAILGRPAPLPKVVPPGFARTQIAIDPTSKPAGPRFVHQSFGFGHGNIARLDAYVGTINRADSVLTVIGGKEMTVFTKQLQDGSTNVTYAWNQTGLGLTFHVNLTQGLTRETADAMAGSIE